MNSIHGYTILERIHITKYSDVYNGTRDADGLPVVIKISHDEEIAQAQARAEKELAVIFSLENKGVIKGIEIKQYGEHPALILERFLGDNLSQYTKEKPLPLKLFLDVAIQIAKTTAWIHQRGVIHKDIKPSNILIDPDSHETCLTDFGTAASLDLNADGQIASLQGSLPYISPEQTGRMGHCLDHRSDLYSLGVTFYEILTGRLPFTKKSSLEMIHAHLALKPKALTDVNQGIPSILSDIIMKLLAKAPENRYQTAEGLSTDLENCRDQLEKKATILPFNLAQFDRPRLFLLPQKAYGRDLERQVLIQQFNKVCAGHTQLILLSGVIGVGKSALINELQRPTLEKNGHFIIGKFDRSQNDIPFIGIGQAISNFVDQLLAENHIELERARSILINETDSVSSVIFEIAPALRLLTGPQKISDIDLSPAEAQHQIKKAFSRFISLFSTKEQPLILFLEDLQWADTSSLMLIESIISESLQQTTNHQSLLILGSYVSEELPPHHALKHMIERLIHCDAPISQINLSALQLPDIEALLFDTLQAPIKLIKPLAELVARKTDKNPFFIHQFLKHLHSLGLFKFDSQLGWTWQLEKIEAAGIPDHAAGMMAAKIQHLSPEVKEILTQASIIGGRFDLPILSNVIEVDERILAHALQTLVTEGIIVSINGSFSFIHDEIKETAAKLIPQQKAKLIHLKVGRWSLKHYAQELHSHKIFEIVGHLNQALDLVERREELLHIAQLNQIAGQKALEASAWPSAENYFSQGLSILDEDCWHTHYSLTFSLNLSAAKANFQTGKTEQARTELEELLLQELTPLDASTVYERLISLNSFLAKPDKACQLGIRALALLGRKTTLTPNKFDLGLQTALTLLKFWRIPPEKILALPEETDKTWQATARIISEMSSPAHMINVNLALSNSLWIVRNTPKYGLGPHSAHQLMNYAILRGPVLGDFQYAYDIAQAALEINRTYGVNHWTDKVNFIYNVIIRHWIEPLQDCILSTETGASTALESGDNEIASLSCLAVASMQILTGEHLTTIERSSKRSVEYCQQTKFSHWEFFPKSCLRLISVLKSSDLTDNQSGEALVQYFDLDASKTLEIKPIYPILAGHSALIYYLLEHFELAYLGARHLVQALNQSIIGLPHIPEGVLFYGLAACRLLLDPQQNRKREYKKALRFALRKFKRWNSRSPNGPKFQHPLLFLRAEKARLEGKSVAALSLYIRARESAHLCGYHHIQSIIEERRGTLALSLGLQQEAAVWLKSARDGFHFWGAKYVAQQLEEKYPTHIKPDQSQLYGASHTTTFGQPNNETAHQKTPLQLHGYNIEHLTAFQTILSISEQLDLDLTLKKVLEHTIQSTGAERGTLLLENNGALTIEASGAEGGAFSRKQQALEENANLPFSVLQFVFRTGKPVSLSDACNEGLFCKDLWIAKTKAKSILCYPIIQKSSTIGVLCFENNLITNAFSNDNLNLLELIIAQSANAICNTKLNSELSQKLSITKNELEHTNHNLKAITDSKSQLINTLAHEIRTPMTNVFAVVDLLKQTSLSEEQLEYVTVIKNSSLTFLDLFNDLLDYARIESGEIMVKKETFSIRQSIQEVCDIIAINAQQKGLEFTLVIGEQIPENISSSLKIVRESLLTASNHIIDRTHAGAIHVTVGYTSNEHTKPLALYKIQSSSLHLDIKEQQNYFAAPQQAASRRFNKTHASLYLIKQLVIALGGNIWIESCPERACSIQFSIPLETISHFNPASVPGLKNLKMAYVDSNKFATAALYENLQALDVQLLSYDSLEAMHSDNKNDIQHFAIIFIAHPIYETQNDSVMERLAQIPDQKVVIVCPILEKPNAKSWAQKWGCNVITKPVQNDRLRKLFFKLISKTQTNLTHHQTTHHKPTQIPDTQPSTPRPNPTLNCPELDILLVEDNKDHQFLTQKLLEKAGFQCTIADTGNKAINKFKSKDWDLILMDCELPELDGLEATRIIRGIEGIEKHVTIVAMTSNALADDENRCLDAGMDGYLRKPFDQDSLLNIIGKHTETKPPPSLS